MTTRFIDVCTADIHRCWLIPQTMRFCGVVVPGWQVALHIHRGSETQLFGK